MICQKSVSAWSMCDSQSNVEAVSQQLLKDKFKDKI